MFESELYTELLRYKHCYTSYPISITDPLSKQEHHPLNVYVYIPTEKKLLLQPLYRSVRAPKPNTKRVT